MSYPAINCRHYPAFLGESYFNGQNYALTRSQTPERWELDYLRYFGASDGMAKEVKIFGLSAFIRDRFKKLSDKFYADNSRLADKGLSVSLVKQCSSEANK